MSTFNRTIALLAVTFCGLLAAAQAGAETKIGYVNFQKLLEEAPQTKSAMQSLENEFGPRRRELMTMQTDLKAKEDKLAKESAVRRVTISCWATACCSPRRRSISRPPCLRNCRRSPPRFLRARRRHRRPPDRRRSRPATRDRPAAP
jgi:hypothetical protein